jgi:aminopeptidase N
MLPCLMSMCLPGIVVVLLLLQMDNFYTVTVYEKGSEVVRLYRTLLGKEGFRKGEQQQQQQQPAASAICMLWFALH